MNIEIVKSIEGFYCLWDGSRYLADCGKGVEGEERAKAITAEIHRLQAELDRERGRIPGKYAFLHRHYAMSYVRQRDPDLHNWAANEAGQRLDRDGTKNYQDYVSALEADVAALVEALEGMTTTAAEDPCRYDHEDYCQTHGLSRRPCRMEVARSALATSHPGAPFLALLSAARAYRDAVKRDTIFGIADTEQTALFAAIDAMDGEKT